MKEYEIVYDLLKSLNIDYKVVEHPATYTVEEADKYIEDYEGTRTKTLFLTNKKKTFFYLLVMRGEDRLDIKALGEKLGAKSLKFVSEDLLMDKLGLKPGFVSIFGLINNKDRDVKVLFDDRALENNIITFHPNDNTRTMFIAIEDIFKYLAYLGYEYEVVDIKK